MATKTHEATIEVDVPVRTAYDQWTQFEEFPKFMGGVERVRQVTDDRLHWEVGIGGVHREFEAEIVEQHPDEVVAWRSLDGPTHSGEVRFEPVGRSRTRVELRMEVDPEGITEKAGEAFGVVDHRIKADLERFKAFIENVGAQTGGWRGHITS
jgi:uncharacterized membrane protein